MSIQFHISRIETLPKTAVLGTFVSESKRSTYSFQVKTADGLKHRLLKLEQQLMIQKSHGAICYVDGIESGSFQGVLVCGLGKTARLNKVRQAAGAIARYLKEKSIKSFYLDMGPLMGLVSDSEAQVIQALVEGASMGSYRVPHQKSDHDDKAFDCKWTFIASNNRQRDALKTAIQIGQTVGKSVNIARDLANSPANICTPAYFVDYAKALFKGNKAISIDVIDQKQAQKLGMNAFLGVAKGSIHEPYMLCIHYQKSKSFTAWVGKGVTFDTGGISIKPAAKMAEMKGDMGGGAAVLAALWGATQIQSKESILAIIPLVENMPSDRALKPGDVIVAMNGKSIEIINTDAEGRLILADALCYAVSKGAKQIIDLATLTGACSVALGDQAIGIMGNKQSFVNQIKTAGDRLGERHWQLPLYEEYKDYLKSDVADLVNSTENRLAGTSTAGKFLEQFVDKTPWVHLDIASVMSCDKTQGYCVKGMAGAGVRTLLSSIL